MTPLSDRQRQLLFDYSVGLTCEQETREAEILVASSEEAAQLYESFHHALAPLESVELEPCPDELMERLFARLHEAAAPGEGKERMGELLTARESARRPIRIPVWRNWSEVVAAAAAVVLFVGILFPAVGQMRSRYQQGRCGSNLRDVYAGLRSYASDHDGFLPAVATAPGASWWKVGDQGKENNSNTRQLWVLSRDGYVDPCRFLCPGRREQSELSFDGFNIPDFSDFPSSAYIQYSVRIRCRSSNGRDLACEGVLMADRNPLSEKLPSDHSTRLQLQLREEETTSNSANHKGRGQNALLNDGSVEFTKHRRVRSLDDDMYLLRDMSPGTEIRGDELPASDGDIFLAP
ncbi:MAG TPA: hypothetical protein PKH24_08340 [Sedimentisphaerales bacterium]|jgi:hypothetical protein|nr:hypothetical protein [Sedimentisphaerales bacterium]HNU30777.1 hypothetical protein [Sedimentisphaerales bacterium]